MLGRMDILKERDDVSDVSVAHRLLTVERDHGRQRELHNGLSREGVEFVNCEDLERAVDQLQSGEYSGVITEDLEGDWVKIVDTARNMGITAVLFTEDSVLVEEAKKAKIPSFSAEKVTPMLFTSIVGTFFDDSSEA